MPSVLAAPRRPVPNAILRLQSDGRLVELAAGGFEPAFELLVLRHRPALLRYCRRILGEEKAEDVVQRTFIRAYEVISDGGRVENLRPWLFRVAHNAALDALKDRARHHVQLDEGLNGVERPDQAFDKSEQLREVVAAVQKLPPRQRDAIVLRELEGRSYEEIAKEMALTGGAVRQLLMRARTTLRAACSALTPYSVIGRVPWGSSEPVAARVVEVVGGTGAPVVVAQVCAAAIVTCVAGGGVPEPQRAQPDADRAGRSAQVAPPARQLASVAPLTAAAPARRASPAVPRLVPPRELAPRTEPVSPPAVQDDAEPKTTPVKEPASPPKPKPPTSPQEPSYEYAYPVGIAPPACFQRRRARSACDQQPADPVTKPESGEPVTTTPPANPAPTAPPPGGTPPKDPPASAAPPSPGSPPTATPPAESVPAGAGPAPPASEPTKRS